MSLCQKANRSTSPMCRNELKSLQKMIGQENNPFMRGHSTDIKMDSSLPRATSVQTKPTGLSSKI